MKFTDNNIVPFVPRKTEEPNAHHVPDFEGTDEQRIARLRAAAMEKCKIRNSPTAQYGWNYPESYYKDYVGPQTSNWDSAVLRHFAEVLEVPILKRSKTPWHWNSYNPATGEFELPDCPPISIQEMKDGIDARIAEFGLSKLKLWEWYVQPHPRGHEYWRMDFETRIKNFKE